MRPELVPGLEYQPEGAVPAGPAGESCARESVHAPGFTRCSSGTLCSIEYGRGWVQCWGSYSVNVIYYELITVYVPNMLDYITLEGFNQIPYFLQNVILM